ncbi:MAG: DNA repair protein RecO [Planctomycetes bacterium]|nr:DNA repair protein RecO [Planctomycetota bacterium]
MIRLGARATRRNAADGPRRGGPGQTTATAIVLRRRDFRESSRIVTCLTREHGKLTGLAKGAHRPDSPFLGRIDFLNELDATWSADRGGLRLLVRARLLRERRGLREPRRFLAASHLAWLVDCGSHEGRSDPELFDLLHGGLNLLERCPGLAVPQVVLGLELRLCAQLGALPSLDRCGECGEPLDDDAFRQADTGGLACRRHAGLPRYPLRPGALPLLRALQRSAGRDWPSLDAGAAVAAAAPLPAHWLAAALEQRSPFRRLLFDAPGEREGTSG